MTALESTDQDTDDVTTYAQGLLAYLDALDDEPAAVRVVTVDVKGELL